MYPERKKMKNMQKKKCLLEALSKVEDGTFSEIKYLGGGKVIEEIT